MSEKNEKHGIGAPEIISGAVTGTTVGGLAYFYNAGKKAIFVDEVMDAVRETANHKDALNVLRENGIASFKELRSINPLGVNTKEGLIIGGVFLATAGLTAIGVNAIRNMGKDKEPEQTFNPAKDNANVQQIIASRANGDSTERQSYDGQAR